MADSPAAVCAFVIGVGWCLLGMIAAMVCTVLLEDSHKTTAELLVVQVVAFVAWPLGVAAGVLWASYTLGIGVQEWVRDLRLAARPQSTDPYVIAAQQEVDALIGKEEPAARFQSGKAAA